MMKHECEGSKERNNVLIYSSHGRGFMAVGEPDEEAIIIRIPFCPFCRKELG